MKPAPILAAALAAMLAAAAPAILHAQTVVPVPEFRSIALQGGGKVTVRHARVQRVTLVSGDAGDSRIEVDRKSLRLSPCRSRCSGERRFEVLVETPDVDAFAIQGGGAIEVAGGFPRRASVAAAVSGGGRIDLRALEAASVSASVRGGGDILAGPSRSLAASVQGGGSIRYLGDPALTSAVQGGGSVTRLTR
ncbi:MAG: GIN domain-containing protein [Allosphingosinicella sp.]|uniref:GIN domain-containing protein n=1 Tax=Allosphingosinicella sp. TaxID=2823234 RepID=UPI003943A881